MGEGGKEHTQQTGMPKMLKTKKFPKLLTFRLFGPVTKGRCAQRSIHTAGDDQNRENGKVLKTFCF